jgi:hypothetical protein
MKFVASYRVETGENTALCALPPVANAPSPGMQLRPGEARAEFEVPDAAAAKADESQLQTRMDEIITSYRLELSHAAKLVKLTR